MSHAGLRRYRDQQTDWRARLFGLASTGAVALALMLATSLTWTAVRHPPPPSSRPMVVELLPLASPPEPALDVVPGPRLIEQKLADRQRETTSERPIPQQAVTPAASTAPAEPPATDPQSPALPISAPVTVPAEPATRLAAPEVPDWEATLLAHLGRFRQYPARARAARQTGVVQVRFRMNRAGMVSEARVIRSSGSVTLDQAAIETLRRAQPLPPIPPDRPDTLDLTVPVEFRMDVRGDG